MNETMSISTAPSPSNHPLLDSTTSPSPTTRTTTTTLQPPSLPKLTIHCHLTILTTSLLLFVTSSASPSPSSEGSSHLSPLGCLTYSLPGKAPVASSTRTATTLSPSSAQNLPRLNQPISTTLIPTSHPSTDESSLRLSRILTSRLSLPVYVGYSVGYHSTGLDAIAVSEFMEEGKEGGEIQILRMIVEWVVKVVGAGEGRKEN